jgi:hypothetical protein
MRFSQRIGARPLPKSGLEEASPDLRTQLWNFLHRIAFPEDARSYTRSLWTAKQIWNHLDLRTDKVPTHVFEMREFLSKYWFSCDWPEFYDLVEFIADLKDPNYASTPGKLYEHLNYILEAQGAAYRFIAEELAPLTNPVEVAEVTRAAESAIPAVASHIREALTLLPPSPDASPRNSVKESISAVEAALKHFSGDAGAALKEGLSAFETKYGSLHPALKAGLVKLYGYTSDEKGIRHALVDEAADVTVDDARFMLIVCSAFANYLVALSSARDATGVS